MKELQTGGKIVQQMTKGGAVEIDKATGGAERISARDAPGTPAADTPGDAEAIGGVIDRVLSERRAAKKKTIKKANAEIFERGQGKPGTTRLKFTDAERKDPALARSVKKSDRAADRFDTARAKIPKEKILTIERVSDKPGGEAGTRLVFRERDKPPNGKLTHGMGRPGREAALAVHGEVRKSEGDNAGIEAAHSTERAAEGAGRALGAGYRRMKLQPHRAALRAEEKSIQKNVQVLYERSLRQNPELAEANPIKKALHKQKIKRDYAKAYRESQKTVERAKNTAQKAKKAAVKAKETAVKTGRFIYRHKWKFLILGIALLLIILLISGISSCGAMFGGGFNAIIGTSYTAEDTDITGADGDYTNLESQLTAQIANIETTHAGYDEYRYNLDEIHHNPHTLTSYLTAKFNMYSRAEVQAELAALFAQQYTLTLTPEVEIRYRTETYTDTWTDPETGESYSESYTVEVPYEYHILNVTLVNRSLETVALSNLTPEQAEMYHVYLETRGNRPELFEGNPYAGSSEYLHYGVPPEALSDATFAAILAEAEKYLGYPYVWGGSSPSTSFDCSGYVSWVINHSGWNVGRLGAKGLSQICTPVSPADAKPGDLIFFNYTYAAPEPHLPTHVGIYVGGGYMIHCGNPISYASITTNYWVNHFYGFGRLPGN